MGFKEEYSLWLSSDATDEQTKSELQSIADDDKEID